MDKKKRLGLCIRTFRKEACLTQEALAEATNLSIDTVSKIERGVSLPQLETLFLIAQALDVPMSALVGAMQETDRQRTELMAQLNAIASDLPIKKLQIAINQMAALK